MAERDPNVGVTIAWWRDRDRALAFYAAAASLFLFYIAFGSGQFQPVHRGIMGVFGAALAYLAAARAINVTQLGVRAGVLEVHHGPLPLRSALRVELSEVAELGIDRASARLRLRTARGEEIQLLDEVRKGAASRVDRELEALLRTTGEDEDAS